MRKRKLWLVLPILLYMLLGAAPVPIAHASHNAVAVKGQFDAGTNAAEGGTFELDGEWEFYWMRLLDPQQLAAGGVEPEYVSLPHVWGSGEADGIELPKYGYATYRLTVKLGEQAPGTMMALYMPSVATAYKLWIDGRPAAGNGVVGTSRESMKPENYAKVVYFRPDSDRVELVVQVSNYVQRKGGLWEPIVMGDAASVDTLRERHVLFQIVISSALMVMGVYHAFLYAFRRRDKLSAIIGVLCLLLTIRMLTTGDILIMRLWPGLPWEGAVKLEYLSPFVGIPLFSYFILYMYPAEANRRLTGAILVIGALFSLIVILFPARIYTLTMQLFEGFIVIAFLYDFYVCATAAVRRREGALMNAAALLIMFAAIVNDILYYNHLIHSIDFTPWGVFVFVFAQTLIVAMKFSKAFFQVEGMSAELKDINATLEDRIGERTAELARSNERLREANDSLVQAEEQRRRLYTNISHELGTPMTSIQGYLQAMIDGVVKMGDPKYIRMILEKTRIVNRLTRELLELSKLESQQVVFSFQPVGEAEFIHLFTDYEAEVQAQGLRFVVNPVENMPENRTFSVKADKFRIGQVIGNMVSNALKFTPTGGSLVVTMEMSVSRTEAESSGTLKVRLIDTGMGIDEQSLPFLFDRFYKGTGKAKEGMEGSGLGLAIAKEIILQHGGTIGVDSRQDEGSAFYFTLPAELLPLEE